MLSRAGGSHSPFSRFPPYGAGLLLSYLLIFCAHADRTHGLNVRQRLRGPEPFASILSSLTSHTIPSSRLPSSLPLSSSPKSPNHPLQLPPRPRLILTDQRLAEIKGFIANNSDAALFYRNLGAQGEWILSVPAFYVHKVNDTNDLGGARQVLQRVYALGMLYRITNNETWADRCVKELVNAVAWHDWALPVDALVTGEMQHTLAVGIDWLDAYWKEQPERAVVRASLVAGLVQLGMEAMKVGYTGPPFQPWANNNTFINTTNNYGEVVNAGTVLGVLALLGEPADTVPSWVQSFILPNALHYLVGSFDSFAPKGDGAWYEGPNYEGYVMRYAAPLIAALQSVFGGDDHGFLEYPGVESAALATVYHLSPQYTLWNWGDAREEPETTAASLAFADHFDLKGAAFVLRDFIRLVPVPANETGNPSMQASVGLLYFTPRGDASDRDNLPKDRFFPGRELAIFWSSWSDVNATFVGVKAGNNGYNVHLHQDMGSFMFHSRGRRFFMDLGLDNYALPCYFCLPQRYHYYRVGALGHNTITFNNRIFDYPSSARIISFNTTGNQGPALKGANAWVVMDLWPLYMSTELDSWKRGFALLQDRTVLVVVDEIIVGPVRRSVSVQVDRNGGGIRSDFGETNAGMNVTSSAISITNLTWAAHSNASVTVVDNRTAHITIDGVTAALHVLPTPTSCPDLTLSSVPINLSPPQFPTPGIMRTQLVSLNVPSCTSIAVAMGVDDGSVPRDLVLNALNDWEESGPIAG